jgi:pimeloyl-[acyl-carrier protein] methyl ester esterase
LSAALHVESAGAGPPLVLLHGWGMHSGMWGTLPARLGERFRVHSVDLPGHGHSAARGPWTIGGALAALESTFAGNEAPLIVVGWSLGGIVALEWARAAPTRIARMVLIGTTPCFVARDGWPHAMSAETLARFGDELAVAGRTTLLRFLTLQLQESDDAKALLAALRARLAERPEPARDALAGALAVLASTDLRGKVASIAASTLVIAGERDTIVPSRASAWLAQAMGNATFVEIARAGHVPFLSHASELADAVERFLAARGVPGRV